MTRAARLCAGVALAASAAGLALTVTGHGAAAVPALAVAWAALVARDAARRPLWLTIAMARGRWDRLCKWGRRHG